MRVRTALWCTLGTLSWSLNLSMTMNGHAPIVQYPLIILSSVNALDTFGGIGVGGWAASLHELQKCLGHLW